MKYLEEPFSGGQDMSMDQKIGIDVMTFFETLEIV